MNNYITLEDLKDFEVWKSWRNGGGLELEPIYKEKEINLPVPNQRIPYIFKRPIDLRCSHISNATPSA